MNTNNLPQELKDIPQINSVEEMVEIAKNLTAPSTKVEKYTLHLAERFFKNNIESLTKQQFIDVTRNSYLVRNLNQKETIKPLLLACIKHQVSLPNIPLAWFGKDISTQHKKAYFEIINAENNKEQIDLFLFKDPEFINREFRYLSYQSNYLINCVLDKKPENIFNVSTWNENQIVHWLNSNKDKTITILSNIKFDSTDLKIKNVLYHNLLEKTTSKNGISEEDKTYINYSFQKFPTDYLFFVKKNYPDFFSEFMNKDCVLPINRGNSRATVNGAQFLLASREYESIGVIIKLFEGYESLLLKNVKEEIGLFIKEVHPFELAIRIKENKLLYPFNLKSPFLNSIEKELILSAAFFLLGEEHCTPNELKEKNTKTQHLINWGYEILQQSEPKLFDKYFIKYQNGLVVNKDFNADLNSIKLMKKLESTLTHHNEEQRKNKI